MPQLRERATAVREAVFIDAAGRSLARLATQRRPDREVEIARADLSGLLVKRATSDADFRFDDTIVRLDSDQHGVDVSFATGPPGRFDLVVGADGLHSEVRRIAFGPAKQFRRPLGLYVATTRLADGQLTADRTDDQVLIYNEPGQATAVHPGTGSAIVAFMFRASNRDGRPSPADAEVLLRGTYGRSGWRTGELLQNYLSSTDVYFDAVSRVRVPCWSHGRITLLGDAASAVSLFGEGSSAALAGAKALSESLAASPGDVDLALRSYEAQHRPRVVAAQRPWRLSSHVLIPATRAEIDLRNRLLRFSSRRSAT